MSFSILRGRGADINGPVAAAHGAQLPRGERLRRTIFARVTTGVMIALGLLWLAPVLWAVDTAVKPEQATIRVPADWDIPHLTFSAFSQDFSASAIGRWYINSAIVAIVVTLLTVVTSSMAGYALSRQSFRGKNVLYGVILAGIMIPPQALMVPLFREFQTVGGLNTYWALILPQVPSPIGVFIFKKFFDGLPRELDQAARMDGASWWTTYRKIALPLSRSAVAAVSIFTFVWTWNNFLWPFLSSTNTPMMTIPVGLGTVIPGEGITNALVMASAILGALPLVIVFLFGQRQIVEGVAGTGLK